jgi:hypothetical protein
MISLQTHPTPAQLWFAAAPPHGGDDPNEQEGDSDLDARSLSVLIVEDEFFISLDMQNLLQALGHAVVGIAVSADEAVRIAERQQPDVALVDIRLSAPAMALTPPKRSSTVSACQVFSSLPTLTRRLVGGPRPCSPWDFSRNLSAHSDSDLDCAAYQLHSFRCRPAGFQQVRGQLRR